MLNGNAYVTGPAGSTNFPVTGGVVQASSGGFNNSDFVTEVNGAGTGLVYSTYTGGINNVNVTNAIAVDAAGDAFITGRTTNFASFPSTPGAFQSYTTNVAAGTSSNAFILKLNPTGTAYLYATLLAGTKFDEGKGIAIDSTGDAFVTGDTQSNDFPVTAGVFQPTFYLGGHLDGGNGAS